jgi:hypothetical protein
MGAEGDTIKEVQQCQHYPSERPMLAGRRIEGGNSVARAKLSLTCVGTPNTFDFALPNAC